MKLDAVRSVRTAMQDLVLAAAAPVVILVLPALVLIERNRQYFVSNYVEGWLLYRAALIMFAFGLVVLMFSRQVRWLRAIAYFYALLAPAWFVHTLLKDLLGQSLILTIAAAAFAAIWLVGQDLPRTMQRLTLISGIVLLSILLPAAGTLTDLMAKEGGSQPSSSTPATTGGSADLPNVYHLILDEFQIEMFEQVLDDDLRRDLQGFTYFPEVTTVFGRTETSIASTFSAATYDYDIPLARYVDEAFDVRDSPLATLKEQGYSLTGYVLPGSVFGRRLFDEVYVHRRLAREGVLPGDQDLVASLWAYANLPAFVAQRVIPPERYRQLRDNTALPPNAPSNSAIGFRRFVLTEQDASRAGRYTIVHALVPHYPYVLTRDCQYREGEVTGPVAQTRCTMKLVREFITTLKDLGRFDDATIVIHGDHGARFELSDGRLQESGTDDPFRETYSRWRARPLVLFKPADARNERLKVSPVEGTLNDILPTVFDDIGLHYTFDADRAPLTSPDHPRGTRYYHFYAKAQERPRHLIEGPLFRYRIEHDRLRLVDLIQLPKR
jgi:hypothetical protein